MVTVFQKKLKQITIYLFLILLVFVQSSALKKISLKPLQISTQESSYTLNAQLLKIGSLGNPKLVSSFLWSYTLLNSDTTHIKNKEKKSWMFSRFNTISLLDKKFYENYLYGGKYLAIIKDDIYGAELIYSKGLQIYKDDFQLLWNAGFNYYYGLKEYSKAFDIYSRASLQPESKHIVTLPYILANLAKKNNNPNIELNILIELYKTSKGTIREKLEKRIKSLKKEREP